MFFFAHDMQIICSGCFRTNGQSKFCTYVIILIHACNDPMEGELAEDNVYFYLS